MNKRRTSGAVLMCAIFMLVAAAPLVQSADDVHEIVKTENGPPSTCALDWDFVAPSDGVWYAHVENHGMRWIIFDMIDTDESVVVIDRDMYRYAVTGDVFDTVPVGVVGGHLYQITGTPNGPLGTSVTVTDVFEPSVVGEPPVATFTYSVDGLTVSVDASGSYDPDGTITDYDWDWGDGSVGTGETASHTYVPPETETALASSSPTLEAMPPPSYFIWGYTKDSEGNPLGECTVTITNPRLGESRTVVSLADGRYMYDLANMATENEEYYADGDEILVEAVKDTLVGSSTGYVDTAAGNNLQLDVILEGGAEPFEVTITLTVTDNDGMTSTWSETLMLYP